MLPAFVIAVAASAAFLPPDDPGFDRCLDPRLGVRLEWPRPETGAATTYLLVKRLDRSGRWRPWLNTRHANPPFTLTLQTPLARRSRFAWMVFEVEGRRLGKGAW